MTMAEAEQQDALKAAGVHLDNATHAPKEWDRGGLCGCCSNGRGCKQGCQRICYTCCCASSAQTRVSQLISKVTGTNPNADTNKIVAAIYATGVVHSGATSSTVDDMLMIEALANNLQADFQNKIGPFRLSFYSGWCSVCMLTWMWNTAENILKDQTK